jgi:hypothetical protein
MTTAAPIYVNPSGPGFKEFLSSDTISVPGTIALPTFTPGSVIFAGAGGVLAQDNANLFWNAAAHQLKVGTPAVVATQAVGLLLTNPTLSTNPVPEQYSPVLVQQGHAWSNALGVDKVIEFATQVETIESGVGLATGNLHWYYQYDSGGWGDIAFMDATGRLSVSVLAMSTFTAGSIPFVKAAAIGDPPGLLTEDNANLFWDDTNNRLGVGVAIPLAPLHVQQTVTATGARKGIIYTGAVNTNQTLSTEISSVTLTTAGREWATGAIGLQREVLITAPTYSFVGGSTITNAATVAIAGAPAKGANATITNTHALLIEAGAVAGAAYSYGLTVNAQTGGGTADYCAAFLGGLVGVGVAVPLNTLHVSGDLRVTGALGVYQGTAGGAFAQYDVLYGDGATGSGYFMPAVNDTAAHAAVIGVAVTGAGGITSGFTFVTAGIYKMNFNGGNPAIGDLGKPVYLSAVAGKVTLTPPAPASGLVCVRVGYVAGPTYGAVACEVAIHVGDTFVV